MAQLTEKKYANYFGKNLVGEVLKIDTELVEAATNRVTNNTILDSFDTQASFMLDEDLELTEDEIKALYD